MYAGLTHRFLLDGESCDASIHIDAALEPRFRRTLAGARLIAAVGREHYATYSRGQTQVTWGFPEPALHRIGLRFLEFEVLRDLTFLVQEVRNERDESWPRGVVVEEVSTFGDEVDALWASCALELGTAVVRDARYLNWRYAQQPGLRHVLLLVRDEATKSLRGLAVARDGGWDPSIVSLLDWVVPQQDRDAEVALVRTLRAVARVWGRSHLVAWFAGAPVQHRRFQCDHGFHAQTTPYQECFRSRVRAADRRWLHDHWYQTMGDVDFF